jgi:hypothetical protein
VPPFTLHQFSRADDRPEGAPSTSIDLLVKEWTSPPDFAKEMFFRNLLGVVMDRQPGFLGNIQTLLAIFVVMNEHDNYPVFVKGPSFLGSGAESLVRRAFTYSILGTVAFLGRLCGFKSTYPEYTADHMRQKKD